MRTPSEQKLQKRVLLIGAGLANLYVITLAKQFHAEGVQLTLVDSNPFWLLPNMATEVVSGYYGLKDFHLDLRLLAKQYGIEFIQDEAISLLPQQKKIMTAASRILNYDLVSFALGTVSLSQEGDVPVEGSFSVKPLKNVLQIRNEIETLLELFPEKSLTAVVLGAGAAGVEYALNIADLLQERRPQAGWRITLLEAQARILPGFPQRAAQIAEKVLMINDVVIRTGVEIQHVQSNRLILEYGETMNFDLAVVALGGRVTDIFMQAGLDTDEFGAVRVEPCLRVRSYPDIFASGDCAYMKGRSFARTTQSAIQQGPILAQNLLAALKGKALKNFPGLKGPFQIISLGKANAMFVKGNIVVEGPWILRFKHWRDRRIIQRLKKI